MPYFEPSPKLVLDGVYTVDTLPTPGDSNYGYLAKVSDLFGQKNGYVICQKDGSTFFWEPTGTSPAVTMDGNQAMTFLPLKMPSIITLTGTLTANRQITMSTVNAYPGQRFEVKFGGSLGLFGISISGLAGGLVALLLNQDLVAVFDASGQWKRLN